MHFQVTFNNQHISKMPINRINKTLYISKVSLIYTSWFVFCEQ